MRPTEFSLAFQPKNRFDIIDVRALAARTHGEAFTQFPRHLYASKHSTAGFLPVGLAGRLGTDVADYVNVFREMFPESAGYRHDQIDLREELAPEQKATEPTNADSHLTFITSGLRACVTADSRRPVYLVDLDGTYEGVARKRQASLVGFTHEEEVARVTVSIPVSAHPIDAVSLTENKLGVGDEVAELIATHGVTKGRLRFELAPGEQFASLTVNEYETLLMRHDLAEVLEHPFRFASEKVRHMWNDPRAVPGKVKSYAKYDLPNAVNSMLDKLGIKAPRIERLIARSLEGPASRFMRMRRSIDLLVSDSKVPGQGAITAGTYQTPILVQWRSPQSAVRKVEVALTRFE